MTPLTPTPQSVAELVKLVAKHGKRAMLVSGVDPSSEKPPAGRTVIDVTGIESMNAISSQHDRVTIGTGMNFGRLAREATGENGLIQQAASIIANPLVRNRVTLVQALDPDSPYFDITTPLVLLDSKVRLQNPAGKRTLSIRDFLEALGKGLKKGEIPLAIEFPRLPSTERVGFFRVARMDGKGSVSAAARMRLARNVCMDPEIVVSSLSLVPLRSKAAEKEIAGKLAGEDGIKKAAQSAAEEIDSFVEKHSSYERSLIEITVSRTLRGIMQGSLGR